MEDSDFREEDEENYEENFDTRVNGDDIRGQHISNQSVASPVMENAHSASEMRISQMQIEMKGNPNAGYSTSSSSIGHHSFSTVMMQQAFNRPAAGDHHENGYGSPLSSESRQSEGDSNYGYTTSSSAIGQQSMSPVMRKPYDRPAAGFHDKNCYVPPSPSESKHFEGNQNKGYTTSSSSIGPQSFWNPMKQQACDRPAAGLHARHMDEEYHASPSAGRQYEMSSDILGTGIGRSWSFGSSAMQRHEPPSSENTESTECSPSPQPGLQQDFASSTISSDTSSTEESTEMPVTEVE